MFASVHVYFHFVTAHVQMHVAHAHTHLKYFTDTRVHGKHRFDHASGATGARVTTNYYGITMYYQEIPYRLGH